MADPLSDETKLGPMLSVRARDDIHARLRELEKGAKLLLGGKVPDRPGPGIRRRC